MKKLLVATEKPFSPIAIDQIKDALIGSDLELVLLEKYTDKAQLLDAVKDVDAMIVRSDKVTSDVLDAAKNLKIVVRAGAGYDSVDTAYAKEKNVVVENTPGQNSNAVAELQIALAVMAMRNFLDGTSGGELKGKKIGIHGLGNIGKIVANIAKGFGMDVYAYVRNPQKRTVEGITYVENLAELFKKCDVISLNVPANADSLKSINYDLVKSLPNKAIIVNTARAEIIDEEGLLKALQERPDIKYATDIKPVNVEGFEALKGQYFSTPKKMGAQTAEANINAGVAAARQIRSYFETGDETFRVNK